MSEQELLADCLRRLNRSGVTYYLTGSMASNYWGIPRTTHDLDFVIQLPVSAVPRIMQEFSGDFYIEEAAVRAAYQPPHQFNAIDTRSALKVDFWLSKPGLFDREMLKRRIWRIFKLLPKKSTSGKAISICLSVIEQNPNGIPSFSPGLIRAAAARSYPGLPSQIIFNPEWVASLSHRKCLNPFRVLNDFALLEQAR
jgi:hypothetical protein